MTALSETAPQGKPEIEPEKVSLITDKDKEEFGGEMIDLQRRVAQEEVAGLKAQNDRLLAEIGKLQDVTHGLADTQMQHKAESFEEQLTKMVPTWQQIDEQLDWRDWLADVDPMAGAQRQQLLKNAVQSQNATRVAAIFNAFTGGLAPAAPAPNPQSELSTQVSPGRSVAPVAPAHKAKIWTSADLQAALDPRKLKHMTSAEITAVTSEIDIAQLEGRIQN